MLLRIALITSLGLLTAVSAHAEIVYVDDMLRVGVRSQPRSNEAPTSIVTTGAELTVLERERGYMRIRTPDGVEGWVNAVYVSSEPPARLRIKKLQSEHQRLQEELKQLRSGGAATVEQNQQLSARLEELTEENTRLHTRLGEVTASLRGTESPWRWLYRAGGLIGLFLLGFYLGLRWYRQRVAARLGGLEI